MTLSLVLEATLDPLRGSLDAIQSWALRTCTEGYPCAAIREENHGDKKK